MASRRVSIRDLAATAGVDTGTVGDFLNEVRWPVIATQGAIEVALGLEPGSISRAKADAIRRVAAPNGIVGAMRDGSPTAGRGRGEELVDSERDMIREAARLMTESARISAEAAQINAQVAVILTKVAEGPPPGDAQ